MTTSTLAPAAYSDAPIWDIWLSLFRAPALAIANELGLFSMLHAQPVSVEQLATQLAIERRATEAIVGVLAGLDLVVQIDGRLHLTDVARTFMLPESPYFWGAFLRQIFDAPLDSRKLFESLRRGTAAAEAHTATMWQAAPVQALVAFTHGMHAHSFGLAMRTVSMYGLADAARLLDVGGGSGAFSIAAALHEPRLRCTVLDMPVVCEVAREYAQRFGVANRIDVLAADMFVEPWPSCDRVFFNDIFHDWNDERCRMLAARAYAALPRGGRVLVHEMILSDTNLGPLAASSYTMCMLFHTEGRQRSARDLSAMLAGAGFSSVATRPTSGGYALITGTKE